VAHAQASAHPEQKEKTVFEVFEAERSALSIGVQSRPTSARKSAKPSGATLRCAPPALALRLHNLQGGQLFDADPGQQFGAV
jgi:hypothetical protein